MWLRGREEKTECEEGRESRLGQIAVKRVRVAKAAAGPRRVESFQAFVVEDAHRVHAAHVRIRQHLAAGILHTRRRGGTI